MQITLYKDVFSPVQPEHQVEVDWYDLAEYLLEFNKVQDKTEVNMFNLWQLKTLPEAEVGRKEGEEIPGTVRRCGANCLGLWGLTLDYDANKSIKEVEKILEDFEYIIYTTFSHSPAKDKFRVVLPFDRMMTKVEFELKLQSMCDAFVGADHASYSVSQAMYLHSGKDESLAYANFHEGMRIPVDMFEDLIPVPKPPKVERSTPFVSNDAYKESLLNSLLTCSGVHRGTCNGNGGALTLASLCKSVDASFAEFSSICDRVAASDSSLQQTSTQLAVWNSASNKGITKEARNRFIESHGGTIPKSTNSIVAKMRSIHLDL